MKYFRITGYNKKEDYSFILDCFGVHEELWQFSSVLVNKDLDVLAVSKEENMIDINLAKANLDTNHYILRAIAESKPVYKNYKANNITFKAIQVGDKIYIPNKNEGEENYD